MSFFRRQGGSDLRKLRPHVGGPPRNHGPGSGGCSPQHALDPSGGRRRLPPRRPRPGAGGTVTVWHAGRNCSLPKGVTDVLLVYEALVVVPEQASTVMPVCPFCQCMLFLGPPPPPVPRSISDYGLTMHPLFSPLSNPHTCKHTVVMSWEN